MPTKRQHEADRLDHALFTAMDRLRAFMQDHRGALNPHNLLSPDAGEELAREIITGLSRLRHYYVRPLMEKTQREATDGSVDSNLQKIERSGE